MPMIKCTDEQAYLIELCLETMCRIFGVRPSAKDPELCNKCEDKK